MNLLATTNGVRILSTTLALAIVFWWSSSVWRVIRGHNGDGDGMRAAWVPLALAVLTFQVRWFWPGLEQLAKDRLALVGNCAMTMALMFAIYIHGHRCGTLQLRRAFAVHAVMLIVCIGASSLLR